MKKMFTCCAIFALTFLLSGCAMHHGECGMGQGPLAGKQIHVFVDSAVGNDANNGRRASSAKKSIQAAWNSLPDLVLTTATIHLANGTYREEVKMSGKSVLGKGKIAVVGNVDSPNAVVITGATDMSRKNVGLDVDHVEGLSISGLMVDGYTSHCLRVANRSDVEVSKCKFLHAGYMNVLADGMTQFKISDCEIAYSLQDDYRRERKGSGLYVINRSVGFVSNCKIHHFGNLGVGTHAYSTIRLQNTTVTDIEYAGYYAAAAQIGFESCSVQNCGTGLVLEHLSGADHPFSQLNVANCKVPYQRERDSAYYDPGH